MTDDTQEYRVPMVNLGGAGEQPERWDEVVEAESPKEASVKAQQRHDFEHSVSMTYAKKHDLPPYGDGE